MSQVLLILEEENSLKEKIRLRNTINFKLMSFLLCIILVIIAFVFLYGSGIIKRYLGIKYKTIADNAIDIARDIRDENGNNEQTLVEIADKYQMICEEQNLNSIYLIVPDDSLNDGRCVVLANPKDYSLMLEDYDFSLNEKNIAKGIKESDIVIYTSKRYGKQVAILNGIYNSEGKCGAIVGININVDDYYNALFNLILKSYGSICIIIIVAFIILAFGMLRNITLRLKKISDTMERVSYNNGEGDILNFEKLPETGNDEITYVSAAFNQMSDSIRDYIEKVKNYENNLAKAETELGIAAEIQQGLLPKREYNDDLFCIRGKMKPAKNIGGDFYTYDMIDGDKMIFSIGDVSGKGISAALLMASVMTAIRVNAQAGKNPGEILESVNNAIFKHNPEKMFVTVFVGMFDIKTGILTYSNAGHNPPYLLDDKLTKLTDANNIIIGLFEDEVFENAYIYPKPGSRLVMYTDGVTEAVSKDKGFFGEDRLEEILNMGGINLMEDVMSGLEIFSKGEGQHDDITMLCIEFRNSWHLNIEAKESNARALKQFISRNIFIPNKLRNKIYVALEEIFINICSYSYKDCILSDNEEARAYIDMDVIGDELIITVTDSGKRFDPTENIRSFEFEEDFYDPDTELGGLGRYMAFSIMDKAVYSYVDNKNVLTMVKKMAKEGDTNDN